MITFESLGNKVVVRHKGRIDSVAASASLSLGHKQDILLIRDPAGFEIELDIDEITGLAFTDMDDLITKLSTDFFFSIGRFPSAKIGDVPGGNFFEVEPDGTQVAHGAATTYDDLVGSVLGLRLYEAAGTVDFNFEENTVVFQPNGNIANASDRAIFNFQKPHSAKEASGMHLHIHWFQTNATVRIFTVQYRIQSNNAAKTTAWTTATASTATNNVFPYVSGILNQITRLVDVDLSAVELSSTVQFRLSRTDTNAGDIEASFIDAHVERDTDGSRMEFEK